MADKGRRRIVPQAIVATAVRPVEAFSSAAHGHAPAPGTCSALGPVKAPTREQIEARKGLGRRIYVDLSTQVTWDWRKILKTNGYVPPEKTTATQAELPGAGGLPELKGLPLLGLEGPKRSEGRPNGMSAVIQRLERLYAIGSELSDSEESWSEGDEEDEDGGEKEGGEKEGGEKEGSEEEEEEENGGGGDIFERYEDDFIDDSELEQYKGGKRAKAKYSGFYVIRGGVEHLEEEEEETEKAQAGEKQVGDKRRVNKRKQRSGDEGEEDKAPSRARKGGAGQQPEAPGGAKGSSAAGSASEKLMEDKPKKKAKALDTAPAKVVDGPPPKIRRINPQPAQGAAAVSVPSSTGAQPAGAKGQGGGHEEGTANISAAQSGPGGSKAVAGTSVAALAAQAGAAAAHATDSPPRTNRKLVSDAATPARSSPRRLAAANTSHTNINSLQLGPGAAGDKLPSKQGATATAGGKVLKKSGGSDPTQQAPAGAITSTQAPTSPAGDMGAVQAPPTNAHPAPMPATPPPLPPHFSTELSAAITEVFQVTSTCVPPAKGNMPRAVRSVWQELAYAINQETWKKPEEQTRLIEQVVEIVSLSMDPFIKRAWQPKNLLKVIKDTEFKMNEAKDLTRSQVAQHLQETVDGEKSDSDFADRGSPWEESFLAFMDATQKLYGTEALKAEAEELAKLFPRAVMTAEELLYKFQNKKRGKRARARRSPSGALEGMEFSQGGPGGSQCVGPQGRPSGKQGATTQLRDNAPSPVPGAALGPLQRQISGGSLAALEAAIGHGADRVVLMEDYELVAQRPSAQAYICYKILCHAGAEGLSMKDLIDKGNTLGYCNWENRINKRSSLSTAVKSVSSILPLQQHKYALRCFPDAVKQQKQAPQQGALADTGPSQGPPKENGDAAPLVS